jgi:hypothetical protein
MVVKTFLVIAVLLVLTACGEQSGDVTESSPTESSPTESTSPPSALTITVRGTPDAPAETWTLTCQPPGGDHPNPEAACQALETAARDPFAPVPKGTMCTQMYGGPETATITGTWRGQPVNASYRRTDGCEISRWNAIEAVLGPGGV